MDATPTAADTTRFADGRILLGVTDGIATIGFNNPEKHNAMSLEMWVGFADALRQARDDERVRVLVLRGEGGRAFVSGADISQFETQRATPEQQKAYNERAGAWRALLANFPRPTIASIRGYCIGGGLALALGADIRLAAAGSQFGIPAAKLNIPYPFDGLRQLSQLVGPSWARLLMFTATRIDVAEAERIGLINRAVAAEALEAETQAMALQIAANAPLSVQSAKVAIGELVKDPADRDMAAVAAIAKRCAAAEDTAEGRRAFLEKRAPRFTGR